MLLNDISAGTMLPGEVGERAIMHRLAVHLEQELIDARIASGDLVTVDCEYNLHEMDPKCLTFEDQELVRIVKAADRSVEKIDDYYSFSVFPDIVVHQRRTDENDLLVVELKRRRRSAAEDDNPALAEYDRLKLKLFTRPKNRARNYGYEYGCVVLAIDNGEDRRLEIDSTYHNGEEIAWHG